MISRKPKDEPFKVDFGTSPNTAKSAVFGTAFTERPETEAEVQRLIGPSFAIKSVKRHTSFSDNPLTGKRVTYIVSAFIVRVKPAED